MKSVICLIAVLCVSAQVIDGLKDVKFTITDNNHESKDNRQLVFACEYTKEASTDAVLKVQFKDGNNWKDIYTQTDGQKPTVTEIAGKLETIECNKDLQDNAKITFTAKKVTAAQGTYQCVVGTLAAIEATVYTSAEIVNLNIKSKDEASDAKEKGNFAKGNELHGQCNWELPADHAGLTFDNIAVFHGSDNFLNVKTDGSLDKKGSTKIDAKKLDASTYDTTKKELSLIIKDSTEDMQGDYKCTLNYKDGATAKNQDSPARHLKYTGAGSAAMASFLSVSSLLVLVVSYMKMF